MWTDDELRMLNALLGDDGATLVYHPGTETGEDALGLLLWARALEKESGGRVSVREAGGETPFGAPCLSIGEQVHYLMPPEGHELRPFVEALSRVGRADRSGGDGPAAELIVFVASGCPHCPHEVRAAVGLALERPGVVCVVADAQRNETLAERFEVRSVPMTVLDREMSWTGVLTAEEIAAKIRSRGTPAHQDELLRSLVASGRLDEAAAVVVGSGGGACFARLWRESTTATRIGLMLVAEAVMEKRPEALREAVEEIGRAVRAEDAALRGDTADLLGQIGHPDGRPFVEQLLHDPNPDVAEIAEETLESLREGS
jgi:glutaredoxin